MEMTLLVKCYSKFTYITLFNCFFFLEKALQTGLDNSREDIIHEFTPILEETLNSIVNSMFVQFFGANPFNVLYPVKE